VNYVVGASEPAPNLCVPDLVPFCYASVVLRHAISNTLSLLFDDSFNVHVSVLYNIIFIGLLFVYLPHVVGLTLAHELF